MESKAVINKYATGKFTVNDLAEFFSVSASTIKRKLKNFEPTRPSSSSHEVVLQMDTTYWGRNFGVVLLMDAKTHRLLHHKYIYGKERVEDYQEAVAHVESQGYRVLAIVCDGLKGLRESFLGTPFQYCQFHQLQRIRQLITQNPRLPAAIELKRLASQLTRSDKEEFSLLLEDWHARWKDFLSEKSYDEDGIHFRFTHRRIRSAYYSLKQHLEVLFTYQSFPELSIPNTNNALESFNSTLKNKMRLHRGISRERKEKLISSIIIAYHPRCTKRS